MNKFFLFLFVIINSRPSNSLNCRNSEPFVRTPLGQINGYYKISAEGRRFAAYESVPYAQPPIDELRFQPPVSIKKYTEVINATKLPAACSQYNQFAGTSVGEEDCLYINIYTPARKTTDSLPVIFWIHGGGFQFGTSSTYGPKYLMDRNLIVITVNYRVGPFGFLSTGDDVVPGNMGLKDQSTALKWVSENIYYFGGDPAKVTLMGVSAGGASVHYHYLSPMSTGLFRNGISFSGTTLSPWAYTENTTNTTKLLTDVLNCTKNSSLEIVSCLRNKSASDIINGVKKILSSFYFPYALFPPVTEKSTENYFINDSPINILKKGKVKDAPWVTGVVSEEGLYIVAGFVLNETWMSYTEEHWESVAPYMLHYIDKVPKSKQTEVAKLSKNHYFGKRPITTDWTTIRNLTHLTGDNQIVIATIRASKLQAHVNKSPVWCYFYSYRAAQSITNYWTNTTINLGVSHYDDVFLVLNNKHVIDPTTTESDRAMLQDMLDFWSSVARDGKPNLKTEWPKLNPDKKFQYMHIAGPGNFIMQSNDNLGEIQFWKNIGM